jgi:hypothetical protein
LTAPAPLCLPLQGGHLGRRSTPAGGENRRPSKVIMARPTQIFTAASFSDVLFFYNPKPIGHELFQ